VIYKTTDLCDAFETRVKLAAPVFRAFGKRTAFSGEIATVRVFEDNSLVRDVLATDGDGRVLVVDGAGSRRCALMGDLVAQLGVDHGWSGAIIHGCIRDSAEIDAMDFGVRAIGTCPFRSIRRGVGERNVPVFFAGVAFLPGAYVYVDDDGILVASERLTLPGR
jgi:regulator of ribonuclease activity A